MVSDVSIKYTPAYNEPNLTLKGLEKGSSQDGVNEIDECKYYGMNNHYQLNESRWLVAGFMFMTSGF